MIIDCNLDNLVKLNKISSIIVFDDVSTIDVETELDEDYGYSDLTEEQLKVNKYKLADTGVQAVINYLKNCQDIIINSHSKTNTFIKKYNLTKQDCLDIIHQLKISDYYANTRSFNADFGGNSLIIFEPQNIKLADGRILDNLVIYIKIDLDKTTDDTIALVSMHQADRKDELPYINGEFNGVIIDSYNYKVANNLIYDFLENLILNEDK